MNTEKIIQLNHYIDMQMSERDYLRVTGGSKKKIEECNRYMVDAVIVARKSGLITSNDYEEYLNMILD